jgi:predicted ABC-class ATPase
MFASSDSGHRRSAPLSDPRADRDKELRKLLHRHTLDAADLLALADRVVSLHHEAEALGTAVRNPLRIPHIDMLEAVNVTPCTQDIPRSLPCLCVEHRDSTMTFIHEARWLENLSSAARRPHGVASEAVYEARRSETVGRSIVHWWERSR